MLWCTRSLFVCTDIKLVCHIVYSEIDCALNDRYIVDRVQTKENDRCHVWWSTGCCVWLWRGRSVHCLSHFLPDFVASLKLC